MQRTAGNAAVGRAILARGNGATKTKPPEPDEDAKPKDAFEGRSFDFNTKEGVLEHISAWHTQLLWDYLPFLDREVLTPEQLQAGRAFFIYSGHYQPLLEKDVETKPLMDVVRATIKAVNDAQSEAASEETAAPHLDVAGHRQLFPERYAKEYDDEAARLRKESADKRDQLEQYKVKAAAENDRKSFVDWSEYQTYQVIAAKRFEKEAAEIRKGHFDVLGFKDHRLFFEFDARDEARKAAELEWDVYVKRAGDTHGTWEQARDKQWAGDLEKQGKEAEGDLVAVEVFAVQKRLTLGAEVLSKDVVETWRMAELALTALNPAIKAGNVPKDAQDKAADAFLAFYKAFREEVKSLDVTTEHEVGEDMGGGTVKLTQNPYLGGALLEYFAQRLRDAKTPEQWKWPVDQYKGIVSNLDRYIADKLAAKGRTAEGEELKAAGAMATELSNLLDRKSGVRKVRAVFYPLDEVENAGQPGTPDFRAKGIPLYFYLYREDDEWYLADLTTPHHVKVNSEGGGSESELPMELFAELNTKLRFPHGKLYWELPNGDAYSLVTDEPWRLSEWLTWIGLAAGAVALGFLTAGASVPASVLVIGVLAGAGAAAMDWHEKSEAGVLTTKDIVVDTLAIVGNLATLGAAGLGKVVVSGALKTGGYARLAVYADQAFLPVTLAAVGSDVASFMILAADARTQLEAIDSMPGSEEDRKLARARLVGQLLLAGTITLMSVKGSLPSLRRGGHLYLDVEPNGTLIARPTMSDAELLKAGAGLKSPDDVTELLKRTDLPKETLDRLRAGISQALSVGKLEKGKLEELLAKLKTASGADLQNVLTELNARTRVGAYLGEAAAASMSPATASQLNNLEAAALTPLNGAAARDLDIVADLVAKDASRANAIVKEFGPELLEHIKFNPVRGMDALEKELAAARKQVKEKVPGFFEGIDINGPRPTGLDFKDVETYVDASGATQPKSGDWPADGKRYVETTVTGPGGTKGYFVRTYDPATGTVEMKMAFLKLGGKDVGIPGKVQHAGQQMTPDGSPTVQYMTMYQLKRLGVPAGDKAVKQIVMDDIQNVETIIHLHWLRKQYPAATLDELIVQTASVKYARTSAIQSGYEPAGACKLIGGREAKIKDLLDFQARGAPGRTAEHDALLKKYGFTRDEEMLQSFNISFGVTPK